MILSYSYNIPQTQIKAFILIHDSPTSPSVSGQTAPPHVYSKPHLMRRLKYLQKWPFLHEWRSSSDVCSRTPSKHRESRWGSDLDQLIVTLGRVTSADHVSRRPIIKETSFKTVHFVQISQGWKMTSFLTVVIKKKWTNK